MIPMTRQTSGLLWSVIVVFQCRVDCGGDGVDLSRISGSKYGQYAECGEQDCQPAPFWTKSIFDVVHRTADQLSVFVCFTEMNGQGYLRKLGTHAECCRNPHPEDCSRAADGDSACHTGDVSGADSSSQCRADCLERSHGTVGCIALAEDTSDGYADRVGKFTDLQKAQAKA